MNTAAPTPERKTHHGGNSCIGGPRPESVCILIGPEGGFTPDEAVLAEKAGFEILTLGQRVLRAETAALAAMAILMFELGDLML